MLCILTTRELLTIDVPNVVATDSYLRENILFSGAFAKNTKKARQIFISVSRR